MKRIKIGAFAAAVGLSLLAGALWSATASDPAAPGSCAELLDRADASARVLEGLARAPEKYEEAFRVCSQASELSLDLLARFLERQARSLRLYQGEDKASLTAYEAALERITFLGGADHPARIALLDGLASVRQAEAYRAYGETRHQGLDEKLELLMEAQRVREVAFGENSLEAAAGWTNLAAMQLDEAPATAEAHALKAISIARGLVGLYHQTTYQALTLLEGALRKQGKQEEAEAISRLILDDVLEHFVPS